MKKRTKFLIAGVVAILVLTAGLTTAALAWGSSDDKGAGEKALTASSMELVLADEGSEEQGPCQTFVDRVLEILGLTREQVIDAINQARQEMCDEWVEQRLDEAVASGLINEEEAAEILAWWQSRPEGLEKLCPRECLELKFQWRHHRVLRPGPPPWAQGPRCTP